MAAQSQPADSDPSPLSDEETAQQALQDLLLARAAATAQSPLQIQVLAFYSARDFEPAWSGNDAAQIMASSILAQLQNAYEQGLSPNDYASQLVLGPAPEGGPDAAKYDLALTEALFRYASDLAMGRVWPSDAYKDVRLPSRDFEFAAMLIKALARADLNAFFDQLPPSQGEYHALVASLARYRAILALGGWPSVPAKGDNSGLLLRRLAFEDQTLASNPDPSPTDLEMALVRYQIRNGLKADGKANAETLQALNVAASVRMREIIANMERWRWLPRHFEKRYVRINVPDQSLDLIEDGEVTLHSQ
ncbi:MAG TPA: hypothetical protein VH019_04490, partial [Rhizomicrobium sp.]|nr:hypothetical protein [Rhizomicrobium sp.]